MTAALAAGAFLCGAVPAFGVGMAEPAIARIEPSGPRVVLAIVPPETTVRDLARVPGISPGVLSAGIGEVPAEQTYLDASQGNRVDGVLYDHALPPLFAFSGRVPGWSEIVARAESAPADIVPGLLVSELTDAGIGASAERGLVGPALIAADRHGFLRSSPRGACRRLRCAGLSVLAARASDLPRLTSRLRGDDLLIALSSAPAPEHGTLPVGIAGRGFDGNLTSDSTRTDGYVLSTDIAPTILARFGLDAPAEMTGEPITTKSAVDPGAVEQRAERMEVIPDRRGPVVIGCLAGWLALSTTAALFAAPFRRRALAWLGLTVAYLPLMLLAGAALEPAALAEGLLVGLGAAALAAITLTLAPRWWALAIAGSATVLAYAIDLVAGSGLTALSLLGPDPVLGARFFGIGNELEAILAVLVPAAVAAALTALAASGRVLSRRTPSICFLCAGGITAVIFAAGRFGADAGAAIVLPVGAAAAALSLAGDGKPATRRSRAGRTALALVAAPIAGLAAIALIDLASGGNAHLTRSVLDAGGAGNLAEVAERRLRLSAHDFVRAARTPLFWLVVAGIAAGVVGRRAIDAWLRAVPMARAGLIGACAALAVGVLANDSGAGFLAIGAIALGAFLAYAWAEGPRGDRTQSGKRDGCDVRTQSQPSIPVR